MRARRLLPLWIALATAAACGRSTPRDAHEPRPDANLITAEELAGSSSRTLYDAVRNLRPAWMMRSRPTALLPRNQAELVVYLDGTRFGSIESLRQFSTRGIASVRYFSPSNAEAHFGPGHQLGAIQITSLPL